MPKPYDLRAWRRLSRYKLQAQPLYELCLRAGKIEQRWSIILWTSKMVASYYKRSMV